MKGCALLSAAEQGAKLRRKLAIGIYAVSHQKRGVKPYYKAHKDLKTKYRYTAGDVAERNAAKRKAMEEYMRYKKFKKAAKAPVKERKGGISSAHFGGAIKKKKAAGKKSVKSRVAAGTWVDFVKKYAKKHGISYGIALSKAGASWRRKKAGKGGSL